ncbi:MAG: NAD(P)-dependent oxidoreductase [Deltaproteobacteria bacterium]|nr:NAD(P)-dependent oxidoreductase [Deltaproteobacteria bacterium]
MATLVTGIGLVGTSFGQEAIRRGERLVFFDFQPRLEFLKRKLGEAKVDVIQKDIRDLPALVQAMKDHNVDTVVHTAGLIGGRVAESLYSGLQINVIGTINVGEAVRLTGVKRLVHISTLSVYNRRLEGSTPISEDFPRGDGFPYGNSKVAKELMLEAYQNLYGFELIILRLANVFGLGHFWGGSGGGEKIQTLLEKGLRGEVARIPQEQTMSFEYVYAKDVGRAIDLAATVPLPAKTVFNIGNGQVLTFDELTAVVRRVLPALRVEIIPGRPSHLSVKQPLDNSRANQFLSWEPRFTMESAFKDYLRELKQS